MKTTGSCKARTAASSTAKCTAGWNAGCRARPKREARENGLEVRLGRVLQALRPDHGDQPVAGLRHRESHQSHCVTASRVHWREILFEVDELHECTGQDLTVVEDAHRKADGPWLAVRIHHGNDVQRQAQWLRHVRL